MRRRAVDASGDDIADSLDQTDSICERSAVAKAAFIAATEADPGGDRRKLVRRIGAQFRAIARAPVDRRQRGEF